MIHIMGIYAFPYELKITIYESDKWLENFITQTFQKYKKLMPVFNCLS